MPAGGDRPGRCGTPGSKTKIKSPASLALSKPHLPHLTPLPVSAQERGSLAHGLKAVARLPPHPKRILGWCACVICCIKPTNKNHGQDLISTFVAPFPRKGFVLSCHLHHVSINSPHDNECTKRPLASERAQKLVP